MSGGKLIVKIILLSFVLIISCQTKIEHPGHNEILWYEYPAEYWNSQALHLGNGFIGASFFGEVAQEKFVVTEKSMWKGGPFRGNWEEIGINPQAGGVLPEIRAAIRNNQVQKADQLVEEKFLGTNARFGHFTSIGDLTFSFEDHTDYQNYRRSLDLNTSLGKVTYSIGSVDYNREYFCSYPDNLLVIRFSSNQPGQLTTTLSYHVIQESFDVMIDGNLLEIRGMIDGNQRPFVVSILAENDRGKIYSQNDQLHIKAANSLVFYIAISTNYKLQYPDYVGEEPIQKNRKVLEEAQRQGYDKLKERHVKDYQALYGRVKLDLYGNPELERLPTNQRWEKFRNGENDIGLKEMAFNLGRYLLISSSRPGSLPANLQGGWNTFYTAYWAGNYQSNINIQEIYWPCGPTNLLECHEPWLNWIADLVKPGREIAQRVYGTPGWISHTTSNIWGHTAPVGGLTWGMYPMGSAWHCHHLWEQFAFSQDTVYLEKMAYPIMKEAAVFWFRNLIEFEGYLITAPTVSAEHGAFDSTLNEEIIVDQTHYGNLFNLPGAYQDMQMLWDLFTNTAEAAEIIGEKSFADTLLAFRQRLLPPRIGRLGQLQEWYQDLDNPNSHHRHIAHLFAVAPGHQIHPTTTPELAEAARVSLNLRNEGRFPDDAASGGNWSMAHRIAAWTRLMDGNRANQIFNMMLSDQSFENLLTFQQASWDMGRPDLFKENDSTFLAFQLDASAATPAFMSEMLLQSHMGEIHLLPALPDEWPRGSVKGLLAKGGFEVDLNWENKSLTSAVIKSNAGKEIPPIRLGMELITLPDSRIEITK